MATVQTGFWRYCHVGDDYNCDSKIEKLKNVVDMSEELKGTNIYAPIVPGTDEDKYPTHDSKHGKGGYKEVSTLEERDSLPEERLRVGCKCM